MLECVINVSEGRDLPLLGSLATTAAVANSLLDVHVDAVHNRSVFTLGGSGVPQAARALADACVNSLDINGHDGVHPRLGVVDVVPFVSLDADAAMGVCGGITPEALDARQEFIDWFADLGVPCFAYGPEISLPEVRKRAFADLAPSAGPPVPHATAGACCVGARGFLVAYNVWLVPGAESAEAARTIARRLRRPGIRALGLDLHGQGQVSMNLLDPLNLAPQTVYDLVAGYAQEIGVLVERPELVGLVPAAAFVGCSETRLGEVGLSPDLTIEYRLANLDDGAAD